MSIFVNILTVLVLVQQVQSLISASVFLSVEGGGSQLVGPHCPGTVRLFCEGVNLTFLRWYYNDDIPVGAAFSPTSPINDTRTEKTNPAFQLIELINVNQNENELLLANYESALTLNVSALETQGIHGIGCGNTMVLEYINVSVSIKEDRAPQVFNFSVTESPDFSVLTVTWIQNATGLCLQYLEQVLYEVSIEYTHNSLNRTVHSNNCRPVCSVSFSRESELIGVAQNYTVTLIAGLNSTTIHGDDLTGRGELTPNPSVSDASEIGNYLIVNFQCSNKKNISCIGPVACNSADHLNITDHINCYPDPDTEYTHGQLTSTEVASLCIATNVLAVIVGILIGLLIMYGIIHRKNNVTQHTSNAPEYEEVVPSRQLVSNDKIELERNQSYGPIL